MTKITLERLIYKNYLKTSLTSIFFIELVLVVIYFIVNNKLIEKSTDFILRDLKEKFGPEHEQLLTSKIESRDRILDSIKDFLGKGK
jgi:hypothetical protein